MDYLQKQEEGYLAVREPTEAKLEDGTSLAKNGLALLAQAVSMDLTPKQVGFGLSRLLDIEAAVTDIVKSMKDRVKALVLIKGEVTTEKGSRQLNTDGTLLEIRPHKTGLDPKKVEALLRAKGKNPSEFMDAVISYKVNTEKLQGARFTEQELQNCQVDLNWAVQRPKIA